MLFWIITVPYFVVALVVSRKLFVRILGDSPRHRPRSEYSSYTFWTHEHTMAVWISVASLVAWPVVLLFCALFGRTPHEVSQSKATEMKALEDRYKELEREVMSFGKTELPTYMNKRRS